MDYRMNTSKIFDVQGLTAVITGGSGQLGRVMAQGLALAGAQVAVVSRSAETSAMVAGAINTDGGKAIGIACDVMDRAALERTVEQVTGTFGPVDILINAAEAISRGRLHRPNLPFLTWTRRRW